MESLDLRVLSDVLAWKQAGHQVTLVTVVETWGSAPVHPGPCWPCGTMAA